MAERALHTSDTWLDDPLEALLDPLEPILHVRTRRALLHIHTAWGRLIQRTPHRDELHTMTRAAGGVFLLTDPPSSPTTQPALVHLNQPGSPLRPLPANLPPSLPLSLSSTSPTTLISATTTPTHLSLSTFSLSTQTPQAQLSTPTTHLHPATPPLPWKHGALFLALSTRPSLTRALAAFLPPRVDLHVLFWSTRPNDPLQTLRTFPLHNHPPHMTFKSLQWPDDGSLSFVSPKGLRIDLIPAPHTLQPHIHTTPLPHSPISNITTHNNILQFITPPRPTSSTLRLFTTPRAIHSTSPHTLQPLHLPSQPNRTPTHPPHLQHTQDTLFITHAQHVVQLPLDSLHKRTKTLISSDISRGQSQKL